MPDLGTKPLPQDVDASMCIVISANEFNRLSLELWAMGVLGLRGLGAFQLVHASCACRL